MFLLKKLIKEELVKTLEHEIKLMEDVNKSAHVYATSDELKSEGKYDTRAIEASYLAQAQMKRLQDLKDDLGLISDIEVDRKSNKVELGALVRLEQNNKESLYFISSALGGKVLNINGVVILVISVFSPIGHESLELSEGEVFTLETPKENRSYLVKEIN